MRVEKNQYTIITYAPINFKIVEMIWLLVWLNDKSISNHFDWNEIKVLKIKKKLRYGDWLQMNHCEVNRLGI